MLGDSMGRVTRSARANAVKARVAAYAQAMAQIYEYMPRYPRVRRFEDRSSRPQVIAGIRSP
jgi:hypothetical protein